MSRERRRHPRKNIVLECDWAREARITDLSYGGCYVNTRRMPAIGDFVEMMVTVEGETLRLRGVVVSVRHELGFSIEFRDLEPKMLPRLKYFLL